MPGWKDVLKEDEIWQLVDYVRALPKGILTGNPTVAPMVAASNPTAPLTPTPTNPTGAPTLAATSPAVSPTPPATSAPIQANNTITVVIQNYSYYDDSYNNVVTVPVGSRVVWIAADDDAHTASSETIPRTINSPTLLKGETYEVIFAQPGEYPYFCVPHPYMTGVVVVK